MHTGDFLTELLIKYQVECVFGVPGGQTVALYDGIYRRQPKIRHITLRDERNVVFAADAYARLTNKLGVCDVTVGPGAVKLPSGLLEAYDSSIPVLCIVSDIPLGWNHLVERGTALQAMDQETFLRPLCKRVASLRSAAQLSVLVDMLIKIATSGRPGPVALIVPQDIFDQQFEMSSIEPRADSNYGQFPSNRNLPDPQSIEATVRLLLSAQRPVLLSGGGAMISQAWTEVKELAELLTIPVITTFSGRGIIEDDYPLSLGLLGGIIGMSCAERAARDADVLLMVGCKSGQNSTFNWTLPHVEQKVIQLDIDPAEIGKVSHADVGLLGDAKLGLNLLVGVLKDAVGTLPRDEQRLAWVRSLKEAWQKEIADSLASDAVPIIPQRVIAELNRLTKPDDIIVCDASYPTGWGMLYYHLRQPGRTILAPRGSAGLGFGLPAAIGASFARPKSRIINLAGDGGFSYYIGEFASVRYHGLKIVNIVFNNRRLAWIDHYHRVFFGGSGEPFRWNDVDFAAVARGFGFLGIRVEQPYEIAMALRRALESDEPAVIDIITSGEETPLASFRKAMKKR